VTTGLFSVRGRLVLGSAMVPGAVVVDDSRIVEIRRGELGELPGAVYEAPVVAPGMIDLQVNGGWGVEVDEEPEHIRHIAGNLPSTGVTAWLPTGVTAADEFYPQLFAAFAAARDAAGARPLGLHLEGPFLSPERKGAHRLEIIEAASEALFDSWLEAEGIALVTLAPERAGALRRIRRLVERGIVVSLGHTNATAPEFERGVDAGATMATHLFNAMSPFGHRAPNVVGAALADDRVTAGLIPDGIHADPRAIKLALRAKGTDRCALVTDMMAATGMAPGAYTLSGSRVVVDAGSARLTDGTLAGSIITLDAAVRALLTWGFATIPEALRMVTEVPARLLGRRELGRLAVGAAADLVLFREDLRVLATFVGGRCAYSCAYRFSAGRDPGSRQLH
jgi:N-acetylglucosamine-6-phosphate deacetylase